ncbi:hypothetical protein ACWF9B_04635 [Streptomyces sp. NPDC055089]
MATPIPLALAASFDILPTGPGLALEPKLDGQDEVATEHSQVIHDLHVDHGIRCYWNRSARTLPT